MRPGLLRRLTPLRRVSLRRRRPGYQLAPRALDVLPGEWQHVMERDLWRCIATRFDVGHVCQGRLTFEHVPEAGKNTYGKKPPGDRWHGVAACLGANSPEGWCSTHRTEERAWLSLFYGEPPYPSLEGARDGAST
jgi:hypothetical protein